jgi:hypothetical protein
MENFEAGIAHLWAKATPIQAAAVTLWRLNWIHPFRNGNGRTARAFSYACLCMKYGFVLPGTPTVIDQIMTNRPEYNAALRHCDVTFAETGTPDFGPMEALLQRLLVAQLSSLPPPPAQEEATVPDLVVRNDAADKLAFRAASEAVLGLLAAGKEISEEAVHSWLEVSLSQNPNHIGPAMHYAQRMIHGPRLGN